MGKIKTKGSSNKDFKADIMKVNISISTEGVLSLGSMLSTDTISVNN